MGATTHVQDLCPAVSLGGSQELARVLDRAEDLDAVAGVWRQLAAGSASPTDQFAWARAAAATLTQAGRLQVLVAGSPPKAIAPLIRRPNGVCELLSARELHEPVGLPCATMEDLAGLAPALAELNSPLLFHRLPAGYVPALRDHLTKFGAVLWEPVSGCPWIPLDEGWREPEQRLNAGRRSDVRRARRLAESYGPVSYEVIAPEPDKLHSSLAAALQIEAASWKGEAGSALLADVPRLNFYRRYAELACEQGIFRCCFLRIGSRIAAMQLAIEFGGRFWLLKIGYDQGFARCSPGTLLLLESIRHAARRGLEAFEFLGCVEPWTRMWTDRERPCVALRYYPSRLQGVVAHAAQALKTALRGMRGGLPL